MHPMCLLFLSNFFLLPISQVVGASPVLTGDREEFSLRSSATHGGEISVPKAVLGYTPFRITINVYACLVLI